MIYILNEVLKISDIIKHKRTSAENIKRMWVRRFTSGVKDDAPIMDSVEVNWVKLLDEGIEKAKEIMLQSIKSKRTIALLEGYIKENDDIAESVAGIQFEGSSNKVYY